MAIHDWYAKVTFSPLPLAIYGQTEVAGQKVVCLFTSFFAITHFFVLGGGWHGVSVLHISFIILANICG